MAGFGRFKLTDALPEQPAEIEASPASGRRATGLTRGRGKGRSKVKIKAASAKGKPALGSGLAAEQVREAQETNQAKNAEGIDSRPHGRHRPGQPASRPPAPSDRRSDAVEAAEALIFMERDVVDLGLADNVVVVFGAARGIGAAIARAFAAEGARVVAIDRDPSVHDLAEPLPLVAEPGGRCDRLRRGSRGGTGSRTDGCGRCDHVVFAVGVGSGKFGFPFWKLEPADWEPVLKINLIGAVNVAHAFAPAMAAAGRSAIRAATAAKSAAARASILFLSSVAGQIGSQSDPPYSAAKAALINFAQCAAKDLAPSGVRVNTLCPGMVQTPLNRGVYEAWASDQPEAERSTYDAWTADKIKKLVPLNRWQQPEDIAAMAVFLASVQACNITGQTINVDGGYVMHW